MLCIMRHHKASSVTLASPNSGCCLFYRKHKRLCRFGAICMSKHASHVCACVQMITLRLAPSQSGLQRSTCASQWAMRWCERSILLSSSMNVLSLSSTYLQQIERAVCNALHYCYGNGSPIVMAIWISPACIMLKGEQECQDILRDGLQDAMHTHPISCANMWSAAGVHLWRGSGRSAGLEGSFPARGSRHGAVRAVLCPGTAHESEGDGHRCVSLVPCPA